MKKIFATLLSTPNYLSGVKMLYRSLKYSGNTNHPFVCFCSKDLPQYCIDELTTNGIQCIHLEHSALDGIPNITDIKNENYTNWIYTFDKLLLWGMSMYEKIIFLDSDMIVLKQIEELFEHPDMSAVQAGRFKYPDWVRLNSGCIVFSPNMTVLNGLLSTIPHAIEERQKKGYEVGDQDVLNYFFRTWPNDIPLHLDECYNCFFTNLPEYKNYFGKSPKIIHFIGSCKPWMYKGFFGEIIYIYRLLRYKRPCLFPYLYAKFLSV